MMLLPIDSRIFSGTSHIFSLSFSMIDLYLVGGYLWSACREQLRSWTESGFSSLVLATTLWCVFPRPCYFYLHFRGTSQHIISFCLNSLRLDAVSGVEPLSSQADLLINVNRGIHFSVCLFMMFIPYLVLYWSHTVYRFSCINSYWACSTCSGVYCILRLCKEVICDAWSESIYITWGRCL